jgi:hypothetical protein
MATSGPITYLVIEDQFLSIAARHKRLAQTTAMSSPLFGYLETAADALSHDELPAAGGEPG